MAAAAARAGGDEPIIDNSATYMGKLRDKNAVAIVSNRIQQQ